LIYELYEREYEPYRAPNEPFYQEIWPGEYLKHNALFQYVHEEKGRLERPADCPRRL